MAELPNVVRWTSHNSRHRARRDRFVLLEDEDEEHWLDLTRTRQTREARSGSGSRRVVIEEDRG